MKSCSTCTLADAVRRFVLPVVTAALVLACVEVVLSATATFAAPAAPVISGPTDLQFISHPLGFRGLISWPAVDTATSYRVYDANTATLIVTVPTPGYMIYGSQGVLYRRYVVAVDAVGDTSPPSNTLEIQSVAPVAPAAPTGFEVLPSSVFDLQTSAPPATAATVRVPYDPLEVVGDPADLKLLHYTATGWTDITTSVDTVAGRVIGETLGFSVFAVMEPVEVIPVTLDTTTTLSGPTDVRRRQTLGLTGTVSPAAAPGIVTIVKSRLAGKAWRSEGEATVTVLDGSFSYDFLPVQKGEWRFVATYSGGVVGPTTYNSSTSAAWTVSVQ